MPGEKIYAGQYKVHPNGDGTYRVVNSITGKVHSERTDHEDAMHQRQLLYAVGHGWKPTEGDH